MQISISGKNINVGNALHDHITDRLNTHIPKYLGRVTDVTVVLTKQGHEFHTSVVVNTGTHAGLVIKATSHGSDAYASFDSAAEKIEKQLRRYKRRLSDHSAERLEKDVPATKARKYVLRQEPEDHENDAYKGDAPLVIAEKTTEIDTLTVSEAVMRMDLSDLPALMFFNRANGRLNVVYRRADGNISWLDPETAAPFAKSA